jgi:hypothetical protein
VGSPNWGSSGTKRLRRYEMAWKTPAVLICDAVQAFVGGYPESAIDA